MEEMFRLIDTEAEIEDAPDAQPLRVHGGEIRFQNVGFSYDPERTILHGDQLHRTRRRHGRRGRRIGRGQIDS